MLLFFVQTHGKNSYDEFRLQGYENVLAPRPGSIMHNVKRGHGGVGLFYRSEFKGGTNTVVRDEKGLIAKLKHVLQTICIYVLSMFPQIIHIILI